MTAPHAGQLIDGYLARISAVAADFPTGARNELIDDMRDHIAEARSREMDETDATILNILDRLGEPAVVVADARERLGLRVEPVYRPAVLEVAAVVLLPFVWPIGVILLWISPAWKLRDKLIGTLLPPGGYLGTAIIGMSLTQIGSGRSCVTVGDVSGHVLQNTCSGPSALQSLAAALLTFVMFGLPLVTAGYLAIRLRWGRRLAPAAQ